jgi:hypothetical protein
MVSSPHCTAPSAGVKGENSRFAEPWHRDFQAEVGARLSSKFRSVQILRNKLGTVFVISRKKVIILGIAYSEVLNGTERNEFRGTVRLFRCPKRNLTQNDIRKETLSLILVY